jgi:Flp pilus assembly protein TadD
MPRWASIWFWAPWRPADRADAALARGDEARDRGDWSLAAEQYRLHLKQHPDHFPIWVQVGHALKEARQFAAAIAAYGQALRLDPHDADLLINLGHIHKLMGHRESAIFFYRRSAAQDGNSEAIIELDRLGFRAQVGPRLARQGHPGSKLAGAPPSPRVAGLKGRASRKVVAAANGARDRKDWPTAIERYRAYLALAPTDFAIWVQLGHALKEAGRLDEARAAYDAAADLYAEDADLLLSFGHLHKLNGDFNEAISFYRRSYKLDENKHAREELSFLGVFV